MESMSNAPYLLAKAREGLRMGHAQMVDSMIHDGLWCPFENWHMGNAGETVADVYKVTRDEQDAFAADSHRKAAAAHAAGKFAAEMLPVAIPQTQGRSGDVRSRRVGARRHDRRGAARRSSRPSRRTAASRPATRRR